MKRSWPIPVMVLLLLAGLGGSRAAHSDDWPQFRRDSSRSAASLDRIKLPLTEIWSWTTEAELTRHTPLFHASVWQDRVFFVAAEGNTRSLVCANARTGVILWRQRLTSRRLPPTTRTPLAPWCRRMAWSSSTTSRQCSTTQARRPSSGRAAAG
jgi:hypothetical protein